MKKILIILVVNIIILGVGLFGLNHFLEINDNRNMTMLKIAEKYLKGKKAQSKLETLKNNINNYIYRDYDNFPYSEEDIEPNVVKKIELTDESLAKFCGENRRIMKPDYKKPPIVTLGCSYMYGHGLTKEESFPYLLSSITGTSVYNYSECGSNGIDQITFLKNDCITESVKNTKYYIYLYMHDHISRYVSIATITNYYDELFEPNIIERQFTRFTVFRWIFSHFRFNAIYKGYPKEDKTLDFLNKVMIVINKEVKKYSPNANFIIIVYNEKIADDMINPNVRTLKRPIWDDIQKETGCTVVFTEDLTGFKFNKDYKLKEDIADWHPNAKAWQLLVPLFVKKYIKE